MKDFNDLTIKDSFMFAAVMSDEEQCRRFLSMALEMEILSVSVVTEKTLVYHPEYHGVRLDVLAQEEGTKRRFDVEMQVRKENLPKRSRYYHVQMDADVLAKGEAYDTLPDAYVIFICDFDPVGEEKYRYTMKTTCQETNKVIDDGLITIWFSAKGKNDKEIPAEMLRFLKYVADPTAVHKSSSAKVTDTKEDFTDSVAEQIAAIKADREWRRRYMQLREMLEDERKAGLREGREEGLREGHEAGLREGSKQTKKTHILTILGTKGDLPDALRRKVEEETDDAVLDQWFLISLKAETAEAFEKMICAKAAAKAE